MAPKKSASTAPAFAELDEWRPKLPKSDRVSVSHVVAVAGLDESIGMAEPKRARKTGKATAAEEEIIFGHDEPVDGIIPAATAAAAPQPPKRAKRSTGGEGAGPETAVLNPADDGVDSATPPSKKGKTFKSKRPVAAPLEMPLEVAVEAETKPKPAAEAEGGHEAAEPVAASAEVSFLTPRPAKNKRKAPRDTAGPEEGAVAEEAGAKAGGDATGTCKRLFIAGGSPLDKNTKSTRAARAVSHWQAASKLAAACANAGGAQAAASTEALPDSLAELDGPKLAIFLAVVVACGVLP